MKLKISENFPYKSETIRKNFICYKNLLTLREQLTCSVNGVYLYILYNFYVAQIGLDMT